MKHLFIINPVASELKGRVDTLIDNIKGFFAGNTQLEYDIHVTRWTRDASAFAHRYALNSDSLVRIHSCGGSGTLFEVVNGTIGLPNVQIAAYPMGGSNEFIRYFGEKRKHMFLSIRNQVFSDTISIDAIRCGTSYGISYGLVGLESVANVKGSELMQYTILPSDFCYIWGAVSSISHKGRLGQSYRVSLDGKPLDGKYITMMIANGPCYGKGMNPAVEAHPNDGKLEVYMLKDMSRARFFPCISPYVSGDYKKLKDRVAHHSGKKITISSDSVMCISMDGEAFYETTVEYEIQPGAIEFVCPNGIDPGKLPRVYGRPEEGRVNELQ